MSVRVKPVAMMFVLLFVAVATFDILDPALQRTADKAIPSQRGSEALGRAYDVWRAAHELNGGGRSIKMALGWSKGLSTELTAAAGSMTLDLDTGQLAVEVDGALDDHDYDLWLIDNQEGPGRSVRPEKGDRMLRVGRLEGSDTTSSLLKLLDRRVLRDFELDLVVLSRADEAPSQSIVICGSPSLFQRLHARTRPAGTETAEESRAVSPRSFFRPLRMSEVHANSSTPADMDALIEQGKELFFNETFQGNGRTCGTCHPAENNFTIDPKFIAQLPDTDPLFVAEFVPALAENFEKPELMRRLGLVLENLDGFDDLTTKFVMRGVPHTLAMSTSLAPAPPGADGSTTPPDERTGWSGDGAPGSGTLREFAIGAITQHFPLTLGRVPGTDFRLPTDEELDAMAAFQLSLGRTQDLDLSALQLLGAIPRRGLEIFLAADTQQGTVAAGKCNLCHANAGATFSGAPGANFNFDTGVEQLADQPADAIAEVDNPPDGGFGRDPHPTISGAFGNGSFNTPTLVEAADTGPFFHNNTLQSIEEAVNFYNSTAFNESPSGQFLASTDSGAIGIRLEATQVEAVAAFLRVANALESIRAAILSHDQAFIEDFFKQLDPVGNSPDLPVAFAEIEDAIEVLETASLHLDAVQLLQQALKSTRRAIDSEGQPGFVRNWHIERATSSLVAARGRLAVD